MDLVAVNTSRHAYYILHSYVASFIISNLHVKQVNHFLSLSADFGLTGAGGGGGGQGATSDGQQAGFGRDFGSGPAGENRFK